MVHGIWPEISPFGSSKCIPPSVSSAQPTENISCYDDILFEQHEWCKHGLCAGVKDAKDFFTQVCALSRAPLKVMNATVSGGGNLKAVASDLKAAGYVVFATDAHNAQVELSACADASGTWHLAAAADFAAKCGKGPPPKAPGPGCGKKPNPPAPGPGPPKKCVPGKRGPACKTDSDCTQLGPAADCLRCAHSGFCTAEPRSSAVVEA